MASHSVALAKHATLSAATVDTVTLTKVYRAVEVLNRSASDVIYATFNGATPTDAGDDTIAVPAGAVYTWERNCSAVTLISSGAAAYSVQGVP
jgi:hypothetical protein